MSSSGTSGLSAAYEATSVAPSMSSVTRRLQMWASLVPETSVPLMNHPENVNPSTSGAVNSLVSPTVSSRTIGPERIIFGTDGSWFPRGFVMKYFDMQVRDCYELGFSDEDVQNIFSGNIERIWNGFRK